MFYVYILKSLLNSRYYVGMTSNLEKRVRQHNSGKTISTKGGVPWRLVHQETYQTRADAWRRERQIKSYKGGEAFKKLIHGEIA
ncbi:GIY-YIG nuclease family protein [Candidatus Falkowbacteria bacterium]|nr:GIY-YIG nuclease family protein [Candidatus Falkowbacteria bacterium]